MQKSIKLYVAIAATVFSAACNRKRELGKSNVAGISKDVMAEAWSQAQAYNFLTGNHYPSTLVTSRFHGKNGVAPVLIYIANDSNERTMQIAVKYELKTLIDACNRNGVNWIAYVGTLVRVDQTGVRAAAMACKDGEYSPKVPFAFPAATNDQLTIKYPFLDPNNIAAALNQSKVFFPEQNHQFFLTIKTHAGDNASVIALEDSAVDEKDKAAERLFAKFSDKNELARLTAPGSFDKSIVDKNIDAINMIRLGALGGKDNAPSTEFLNDVLNFMHGRLSPNSSTSENRNGEGKSGVQMGDVTVDSNSVREPKDWMPSKTTQGENSSNTTQGESGTSSTQGVDGTSSTQGVDGTSSTQGATGRYKALSSQLLVKILMNYTMKSQTTSNDPSKIEYSENSSSSLRMVYMDSCREKIFNGNLVALGEMQTYRAMESLWHPIGATWYRSMDYGYLFSGSLTTDDFNQRFLDATSRINYLELKK